jgi:hypothetical protein
VTPKRSWREDQDESGIAAYNALKEAFGGHSWVLDNNQVTK